MGETLVVTSKIKELIGNSGKSMSSELPAKLSAEVELLIKKAIDRSTENGRKTVMVQDV